MVSEVRDLAMNPIETHVATRQGSMKFAEVQDVDSHRKRIPRDRLAMP